MVLCHQSKAFDRVWQTGLFIQIHTYGIGGNIFFFQWFKIIFLFVRRKVMYQDRSSPIACLNTGLLFLLCSWTSLIFIIYVNEILLKILCLSVDYLLIIKCIRHLNEIEFILNHDLIVLRQRENSLIPVKLRLYFSQWISTSVPQNYFFLHCQSSCRCTGIWDWLFHVI